MNQTTILLVLLVTFAQSTSLPVKSERSELARFVNRNGNRSQGSCQCSMRTLDCICRMRGSNNSVTNYRLDVMQASLVVEDMKREDLSRLPSDKNEIPEKRQWPPVDAFVFEDKRLGQLTGKEEPLNHLQIFPYKESEMGVNFTLFFRDMKSTTRPISHKSVQLHVSDAGKQQLPFTSIPAFNSRIQSGDRVALCNKIFAVAHGFRGSPDDPQFVDLTNALFHLHEYNDQPMICVLMIDWRRGASTSSGSTYYAQAAANTITAGRMTALLLYQLIASRQISPFTIHMIGFSLGAHVAHFASDWYKQLLRQSNRQSVATAGASLGRITGLDPAARHFQGYNGSFLSRGDASFVDAIHSSNVYYAGNYMDILHSRYGNPDATADVDFYPNGGDAPQPGCSGKGSSCSHNRAIDYFIDSLNSSIARDSRIAIPCDSYDNFPACYQAYFAAHAPGDQRRGSGAGKRTAGRSISCMGYEAEVFPGRGKMYLNYTATHAGYFVQ